ncbi:MAG: hypothetical protein RBR02_10180 [Desulfuromonadaceae bacterium]|nr:hypothetical protein [Desulfuromonadaceae bacterium]
MEELEFKVTETPLVYKIEYWACGWQFYCYCTESSKQTYFKVAKAKSPISLANAVKIEIKH